MSHLHLKYWVVEVWKIDKPRRQIYGRKKAETFNVYNLLHFNVRVYSVQLGESLNYFLKKQLMYSYQEPKEKQHLWV